MIKKYWIVVGLFLLTPTAFAEEAFAPTAKAAKSADMLGGFAINQGTSVVRMGIGNPGLETTFLYGLSSKFTLGGLLGLNWGEGVDFAVRFQVPLRFALYDSGRLGVAAGFTPGLAILAGPGTVVTIPLYMDLTTGFRITRELTLSTGFEIPLELWTKGSFGAIIPLVAAIGAEYYIASATKLWFRIRAGHAFTTGGGGGDYEVAMAGSGMAGVFGAASCHVGVAIVF